MDPLATKDLIIQFGKKHAEHPKLKFISENPEELVIKNLSENGVVNFVFLVQNASTGESAVIKYGNEEGRNELLHISFPMTRQLLEHNCLQEVHRQCPGCAPEPYVCDSQLRIFAMEYLGNLEVLGDMLTRGEVDIEVARGIGATLGRVAYKTHCDVVSKEQWQQLVDTIRGDEMREIFMRYRFDTIENGENPLLVTPVDPQRFSELMEDIKQNDLNAPIKAIYRDQKCLMHMDLHSMSLMVSKQRTAMIDLEFGGLGHHSYSLGHILAFYYMSIFDKRNQTPPSQRQHDFKLAMCAMVEAFQKEFAKDTSILGSFISPMVAIFGHYVFTWPLYSFFFIPVEAEALRLFMQQGFHLMKHHKDFTTLDQLYDFLFNHN